MADLPPVEAYSGESGRIPPQNLEAEESVLCGILLWNDRLDDVIPVLRPGMFYREKHRCIYAAMLALSDRNEPIDLVTLAGELKSSGMLEAVGGETFLVYLSGRVSTAANIVHYAQSVKDKAILRDLIGLGTDIVGECFKPDAEPGRVLGIGDKGLNEIQLEGVRDRLVYADSAAREEMRDLELRAEASKNWDIIGIPTGLIDMDRQGAMQRGDLIVLAARPGMGKTGLGLNIAWHVGTRPEKDAGWAAIFSMEMGRGQVAGRLVCADAGLDTRRYREGRLQDGEIAKAFESIAQLTSSRIVIDDGAAQTVREIRAKCRRLRRKSGPLDLILIDYLGLLGAEDEGFRRGSLVQWIGEQTRALKELAKEMDSPVLLIHQLNREVEKRVDKRPVMSDLRDSGNIEQDADVVWFVYRPAYYERQKPGYKYQQYDPAEVNWAKNRNGPVDPVFLTFRAESTRFYDAIPERAAAPAAPAKQYKD